MKKLVIGVVLTGAVIAGCSVSSQASLPNNYEITKIILMDRSRGINQNVMMEYRWVENDTCIVVSKNGSSHAYAFGQVLPDVKKKEDCK